MARRTARAMWRYDDGRRRCRDHESFGSMRPPAPQHVVSRVRHAPGRRPRRPRMSPTANRRNARKRAGNALLRAAAFAHAQLANRSNMCVQFVRCRGAVTAAPLRIFGAGGLPRPSAFAPTTPPNWHSRIAPRNTPEPGRAGERMRGWAAHIGPDRCSWRKRPAEPALHAAQHRRSASLKRFACKAGRETAAERETCGAM